MAWIVKMPKLGQTMEKGVVKEWMKKKGDSIEEGEIIAIIESEKFTEELEAREPGILREILVQEDEEVPPGTPIGIVAKEGEKLPEIEELKEGKKAAVGKVKIDEVKREPSEEMEKTITQIKATPAAKKLAKKEDINLAEIEGTGVQNSVTKRDVKRYIQEKKLGVDKRTIYEARELSAMRRTIGERLGESYRQAPHVTLNKSIEVTNLTQLTQQVNKQLEMDLSITDFIIKAVVEVLKEHREFNAIFEEGEFKLIEEINISIAIALEEGLVTPVLYEAQEKDIFEISKQRKRITERTLGGNYTMDELKGGTFTVSNLGPFGIDSFDPIINPPEVAILGINRIREQPIKTNQDEIQFSPHITFSLSFDHRVLDGAVAAQFLETLELKIKNPLALLLDLPKLKRGER